MKITKKTFAGLLNPQLPLLCCFCLALIGAPLFALADVEESVRAGELKSVLERFKRGDVSKEEVYESLDSMLDEDVYASFLGPHIMVASASDMVAPDESERVFRRALASLDGKNFVMFLMKQFDRAMEIDRVYLYDEDRILKDPEYRHFWESRAIYNFTANEFDAIVECHKIFSEKDQWKESSLNAAVNNPPCSKLKDL